eukprot:g3828.t1
MLNRRHAVGGMSSVFIARDEALDREVALKILSEEFSNDETRIAAFEEEARLTASFSHPYVVRVMATGKAFGRLYIAMEFVTGGHFERVIKDKGRVSELEMLPLAIQIAEGLKGAQAAGLIHRDIKPGNILLDTDGNAKIVDFGLALVTKGGKATATEIWATPYYVPPEAIEGREEDFRSDIYAFGATLYHALAGKPPCDEESMATDKLREAKRRIVPLVKAAPDLLPETCAVIDRAMEYEAEDRFGSYDEMIAALKHALRAAKGEAVVGKEAGMDRTGRRRLRRRKGLLMAAAGILLVAVIGAIVIATLPEEEKTRTRARVVVAGAGAGEPATSSEKIVMQYRSARHAMEQGNLPKACKEFTQLLENEKVQEPTRSWAGVQAVLTGLMSGRVELGEEISGVTADHLGTLEGEMAESFALVRGILNRVGEFGFFQAEELPVKEDGNAWVASYMIAGLANWEQGGLEEAVPFFQKVRNSDSLDESGVMGGYQSVAADYLADYRILNSGAMEREPGSRKECRELIEELNRSLTLLKTNGRAKFNVKSRQADLVKLEKGFRREAKEQIPERGLDLMAEIASLAESLRLVEIVNLVESAEQIPEGVSRNGLLAVAQAAVVFLDEMQADLQRRPLAMKLVLRDGTVIDSIVVTTEGKLMGRELSGEARELGWGDFPEDELIRLHRVLVNGPTTELERLRRHESAIAFDWLVGDRDRANEAAARLSSGNEDFRRRPEEVEGMPAGVPHIIGNEAAERFSFYGMKAILAVFLADYLFLMDGRGAGGMDEAKASEFVHLFNGAFYLTPIIGAVLADVFFGKYRVIIWLSLVYCAGHAALAMMGTVGRAESWMIAGLVLISLGAGGIKPCVSAHVGDQFGARNAGLLPRVFNWFYFSINLGAFVSMLLTPWLLRWYGPHWAFGVPGVLMALATLVFWMGRKRFAHVPAGGVGFLKEVFSREGLVAILKLTPVYLFVAVFWALFDQTGSTWIFQSQDMDRNFLGFNWLPSQIQSLNSVFVLTFIPLFSYLVYPWIGKVFPLSPLRKMGIGFVLMTGAFVLVSLIQVEIDGGGRPNISWQILAFALLTAAEIMISIVALEFAYTQAPRKMKSFIMCFYLAAVAVGNFLVAGVNHFIQIPSAAEEQLKVAISRLPEDWKSDPRTVVLPGFDEADLDEVFIRRISGETKEPLEVPGQAELNRAASLIIGAAAEAGDVLPDEIEGAALLEGITDYWGNALRYVTLSSTSARIWSRGGDRRWDTKWDVGVIIERPEEIAGKEPSWTDRFHPEESWLSRRKKELGIGATGGVEEAGSSFSTTTFSGGQVRWRGASYFWFFSALMGATAVLFIPFSMVYRPKSYLQDAG